MENEDLQKTSKFKMFNSTCFSKSNGIQHDSSIYIYRNWRFVGCVQKNVLQAVLKVQPITHTLAVVTFHLESPNHALNRYDMA